MVITGTYNLQVNPSWRNVQQQDVYLECDTSEEEVIINLFAIQELQRSWGVKLYISDIANNANVNPITINTGGVGDPLVYDTIDEEGNNQVILETNGESVAMQVVSETSWIATESKSTTPTPTLQMVTEEGNSTNQDINLLESGKLVLSNNSRVAIGSKDDYEIGGGISQVCSLEKEIQWENGVQYYFVQGEPIIHANSINDDSPDNTYDETKSFAVGSTFTSLNSLETYICLDATTDNAVWVKKSITLQDVLDYNHDLVDGNNFQGTGAGLNNGGVQVIAIGESAGAKNTGNSCIFIGSEAGNDPSTEVGNSGGNVVAIGNGQTAGSNTGDNLVALGSQSCFENTGSTIIGLGDSSCSGNQGDNVIGIGSSSAQSNSGNNVVAIGKQAGVSNQLSSVFIVNNNFLPSFIDHTTASTAISLVNGAVAGNTYLYFDETLNTVGAIRL